MQVIEFVDFKEQLQRSHTRAVVVAESAAQHLRRAAVVREGLKHLAEAPAELAARPLLHEDTVSAGAASGSAAGREGDGGTAEDRAEHAQRAAVGQSAMTFNEDLATRPHWFPPSSCAARLAVADWWEAYGTAGTARSGRHGNGSLFPGLADCWWGGAGAAERSDAAHAVAWREAQAAALSQRKAMPVLLAAAVSAAPSEATLGVLGWGAGLPLPCAAAEAGGCICICNLIDFALPH